MECSGVVYTEHDDKGLEHTISSLQCKICLLFFYFRLVSDLYELSATEISSLRSKQRSLDGKRREALNKILDIKGDD